MRIPHNCFANLVTELLRNTSASVARNFRCRVSRELVVKVFNMLKNFMRFFANICHKTVVQQYMQDIVSESYTEKPKRFWSYVKSKGQESICVASLKNQDGFL